MKCEKVRNLIAIALDEPLPNRQERYLRDHLLSCTLCSAYARRLAMTMSELSADAEFVAAEAELSSDFWQRLRAVLVTDTRIRSSTPAAAIERLLRRVLQRPTTRLVKAARAAAALAGLIAAVAFTASVIQSPPPQRETHWHFGRLASFDAQASDDGRVYAALTARHSIGRRGLREAYRK